jgi:hypothetical protein
VIGVVAAFLLGSFLIDVILPGGVRQALFLTLPSNTGSLMTDYALTLYQVVVLAIGLILGARIARRERI